MREKKRKREKRAGEKNEGNGEKFGGEENGFGFFLAKNREREVYGGLVIRKYV